MTIQYPDNYSRPRWWLAGLGLLILGLIFLLLLAAILLLPPVSLLNRIDPAYTRISRDGGEIQDPDGMRITFLPKHIEQPFWVKLKSIPRSSFLEGSAGNTLLPAAETIPANLVVKGPFYLIEANGAIPAGAILTVPIPNAAEPYRTLDLYSWNGQSWEWLPHRQISAEEILEAELDYLPESVVVVQTHALNPHVSAGSSLDNLTISANFQDVPLELNPRGLYLESEGLIAGDLGQLPPEIQQPSFTVIPTLRNWSDDGSVRSDLIDNLLIDAEVQQRHIGLILNLIQSNAYQGIDLDYRGINPDLRPEYTSFLSQLRQALPENKRLSVRVELPQQVSAEVWNTGAYDWLAISRIADVVKLPLSPNPNGYAPGGETEAMLNWAVGQIDRYKLHLSLSPRSLEVVNGATREIGYQQAIASLGSVSIVGGANTVSPGQEINFGLTGLPTPATIQFDPQSGLYWWTNPTSQQSIYLENAASLARKLQLVADYHLGGAAIQDLFDQNNDLRIKEVARQFADLIIPKIEGQHVLIWRVQDQAGGVIAEEGLPLNTPTYTWVAPAAAGSYQVSASISPNQDPATAIQLGSVTVVVTAP